MIKNKIPFTFSFSFFNSKARKLTASCHYPRKRTMNKFQKKKKRERDYHVLSRFITRQLYHPTSKHIRVHRIGGICIWECNASSAGRVKTPTHRQSLNSSSFQRTNERLSISSNPADSSVPFLSSKLRVFLSNFYD